jgi:hypothetical protein
VIGEGLGFILGQDNNLVKLRVDTITKGKIHDPVNTAKGYCRLGSVLGEWHKPLSPAAGHDEGKRVFHDIGELLVAGYTS